MMPTRAPDLGRGGALLLAGGAPDGVPDQQHHDGAADRPDDAARPDAQAVARDQADDQASDERADEAGDQALSPVDAAAAPEDQHGGTLIGARYRPDDAAAVAGLAGSRDRRRGGGRHPPRARPRQLSLVD